MEREEGGRQPLPFTEKLKNFIYVPHSHLKMTFISFGSVLTAPHALSWVVPQPSHNVWVTLARPLKQDNLGLSMGNPLLMCLVRLSFMADDYYTCIHTKTKDDYSSLLNTTGNRPNPGDNWHT